MNGYVVRLELKTPWNKTYRRFILVTAMGLTGRSFGKAGINMYFSFTHLIIANEVYITS